MMEKNIRESGADINDIVALQLKKCKQEYFEKFGSIEAISVKKKCRYEAIRLEGSISALAWVFVFVTKGRDYNPKSMITSKGTIITLDDGNLTKTDHKVKK